MNLPLEPRSRDPAKSDNGAAKVAIVAPVPFPMPGELGQTRTKILSVSRLMRHTGTTFAMQPLRTALVMVVAANVPQASATVA